MQYFSAIMKLYTHKLESQGFQRIRSTPIAKYYKKIHWPQEKRFGGHDSLMATTVLVTGRRIIWAIVDKEMDRMIIHANKR